MADPRRFRRLRVRLTAVAALAVLAVLVVAAALVGRIHHDLLVENVDEQLEEAADQLVDAAEDRRGPLPSVAAFGDDDAAFQVVGPDGVVVASTANVAGAPPLAPGADGEGSSATVTGLPHDDGPFRLHSEPTEDGTTVFVAASLDDVEESTTALRRTLLVVVPGAAAALALVLWVLTGRMLGPIEAAADRERRFVGDASHELRTPLTRMRTELEVELAHPSGDGDAVTRSVHEDVVSMQRTVEDLLHLARSDSGTAAPPPQPVDLRALVQQAAGDLAAATSLAVDTSGVAPVLVPGHPEALRRLVANLLDNAGRHAASSVVVTLVGDGGDAVLGVADDGPGIPPGDRDRVFERFARLDPSRTGATGGTGLGLAIVHDVAVQHRGSVAVDEAPGGGARFLVRLPASPDPSN